MAWDTDEKGALVLDYLKDYELRKADFGEVTRYISSRAEPGIVVEPREPHLCVRLELSRQTILFVLTEDEAIRLVARIQALLP